MCFTLSVKFIPRKTGFIHKATRSDTVITEECTKNTKDTLNYSTVHNPRVHIELKLPVVLSKQSTTDL